MIGAMTERNATGSERQVVCPFVAFDDDRDHRSSVPDHRQRCFAESPAAARALAHQAAYCLSSAFPGCPTFIDWARREAAPPKDEPIHGLARGADGATPGRSIRRRGETTDRAPRRAPGAAASASERLDGTTAVGAGCGRRHASRDAGGSGGRGPSRGSHPSPR